MAEGLAHLQGVYGGSHHRVFSVAAPPQARRGVGAGCVAAPGGGEGGRL